MSGAGLLLLLQQVLLNDINLTIAEWGLLGIGWNCSTFSSDFLFKKIKFNFADVRGRSTITVAASPSK